MSNTTAAGSDANDGSDWNRAWNVVARLAAARGSALPDVDAPPHELPPAGPTEGGDCAPVIVTEPFAPIAPDQLARDIAEIERVAAALRAQDPTLELHQAEPETANEPRAVRSVWTLVTAIWIFAALVMLGSLAALFLLLG